MAISSKSASARGMELQLSSQKWKDRETSPERTKVWTEPPHSKHKSSPRKVPVVYYLSRNGQLEHPHFMEVPLSSPEGLYLKDVIHRLNFLRGKGMASMYSWSSKRSYKSGFVWHDLAENDFIYPAHGQEYVLKGSELLEATNTTSALYQKSDETACSTSKKPPQQTRKSGGDLDFPAVVTRRRNQSWSSIDLHEYKVYKTDSSSGELPGRAAANASTQTDDKRRSRRRPVKLDPKETEIQEEKPDEPENHGHGSTELNRGEISPPPSDSSPETLETLMKADGRLILRPETINEDDQAVNNGNFTGKVKASSVLMQLISCGSVSFKDCGPGYNKETGFSLISHYKHRLPRGTGSNRVEKSVEEPMVVKLEDKEYFSGSLIETKKDEFPALKRSSSYNADRRSQAKLELLEREIDGVRAKCIPRKPKAQIQQKGDQR